MPLDDHAELHPQGRWFAYWEPQQRLLMVVGPHRRTWAPVRIHQGPGGHYLIGTYKLLGWWNFSPGAAHREAARELARVGLKLRPPEPET